MGATHEAKTATFEANQKVRKEEIEALDKAIEIISNPNVSGSYAEHVNAAFAQQTTESNTARKLSFLQVNSASRQQASRNAAVEFLRKRASEIKSRTLSTFAAKLTQGSPFDKVIEMIENLL